MLTTTSSLTIRPFPVLDRVGRSADLHPLVPVHPRTILYPALLHISRCDIPPPQFSTSLAPFPFHWRLICAPHPHFLILFSLHAIATSIFLPLSIMLTTPASFLMSSFFLCSFREILHIFLNILISVTSSLLSSSLLSAAHSVPYNSTGLITLL